MIKFAKIYLDYHKAKKLGAFVDYKEYMRKYDDEEHDYRLLLNAPFIVNVEGTYIYESKIQDLVDIKTRYWLNSLLLTDKPVEFVWRR